MMGTALVPAGFTEPQLGDMRRAVVTASIRMRLSCTKPITELTVSVMNWIWLPTRSTSAGALPL